jgi:hypothetical protein
MPGWRESIDLETAALESTIRRRVNSSVGGFDLGKRFLP